MKKSIIAIALTLFVTSFASACIIQDMKKAMLRGDTATVFKLKQERAQQQNSNNSAPVDLAQ